MVGQRKIVIYENRANKRIQIAFNVNKDFAQSEVLVLPTVQNKMSNNL
jgi:hypothetical protein